LQPEYTAEEATELHKQMLRTTVAKVCSVFGDVWLAVDDIKHPCFTNLQSNFPFKLKDQTEGSLGDRLKSLCKHSFEQDSSSIMFLGTDSPHVDTKRYRQAQLAIESCDAVLGPVEDGGYDLIALSKPCLELFDGINWGTKTVFSETINKINALHLSSHVLNRSFDLDRAVDIQRAPPDSW
ncbi:MAG: TIGR04282 family arsenosugar biosynthesis glycosyltransferase, partial [Ghiorsea sp.]|nr:TIGR04282 family arsenosugar biosynthesis glycosyltransferase [Ghiorsea sp.]